MAVVNITSDYADEKTNRGEAYTASYSKAISAGSVLAVLFTTPATTRIKLSAQVDSNLAGVWYFCESATYSAGSVLTVINNNRQSSKSAGVTVIGTPTVTTYGTVIETHYVGANVTPAKTGAGTSRYFLATATSYIVYFQANATSTYSAITLSMITE